MGEKKLYPSIVINPDDGLIRPATIIAIVDFPEPLSPTKAYVCPLSIEKLTLSTAFKSFFCCPLIFLRIQGSERSNMRDN